MTDLCAVAGRAVVAAWLVGCATIAGAQSLGGADAIDDARLDALRGGFDLASGVKVSFGVDRVVEVNGALVTSTSFRIPDLAHITASQVQQVQAALNGSGLVRNGVVDATAGSIPNGGLVIQNTLNDQTLRSTTTLNIATSSLGMLQSLNSLAALRDALALR